VKHLHSLYVYPRRIAKLVEYLATVIPPNVTLLDVGCGDGLIAHLLMEKRADLRITGIDVMIRHETHIHVDPFDGTHIPWDDRSFDVVMFVDVLHHTKDPAKLLREARRVARIAIVIKDHTRDGWLASPTLRFMDWVGNVRHGVALPYNYWPRRQWIDVFGALNLVVETWKPDLKLYPRPLSWVFGRSLHFVSRLACR
jgi:SAM-dependent methyltransferase